MKQTNAKPLVAVRRLSLAAWLICLAGLAIILLSLVLNGFQLRIDSAGQPSMDGRRDSLAGFLGALPFRLCLLASVFGAARLFHRFSQGEIFTPATVSAFLIFAFGYLGATLAGLLRGPLVSLAGSMLGNPEAADLSFIVNQHHITGLAVSLVLVTLSFVHTLAKEHAEDVRLIL